MMKLPCCNIPLFWSLFILAPICCSIKGCIESERVALLEFKNGLTDPSNRLADWLPHSSDCCNWSGVVCHNLTSHVLELHLQTLSLREYLGPDEFYISNNEFNEYEEYRRKSALGGKVSSSLLYLKHLSYLDLSNNDFGGVAIPKFIGSMQSLRYLNLYWAGFGGIIPPQLGNLSNLHHLNLHSYYVNTPEVENLNWVTSLSSLEFLDLSNVNLRRSFDWLKVMNTLPSLVELHLLDCSLRGFNPNSFPNLNFSSLAVLDLRDNNFRGPIPNGLQNLSFFLQKLDLSWNLYSSTLPNWFYALPRLQLLHLKGNLLQGQISSSIGNLTFLVSLDLSENHGLQLKKGTTNSFNNFCNLRSLSLSDVKFNQQINDVLNILSGCVSSVLQSLSLRNCQLSGHLTDDLAHFRNLVEFDISNNLISGPIPLSFGNLNKLKLVYISNNDLDGEISQLHFANLTRLVLFLASGMKKNIVLRVSSSWIPPLQLRTLGLRSWNIGPQFPNWLRLLKHLIYLDLSNSEISTPIPIWFWDSLPNYDYLNISHNKMHGSIPKIPFSTNGYMSLIDLSFNDFSGVVPSFPSNIIALDLSHNSFSGSVSNFLCYKMNDEKQTQILNLEGNLLHGEIPDCWGGWKNLTALKLSNNTLSGSIPISIGTLINLQSLHLRNNNLSGEVPSSIQNCNELFLLDISENNLAGKIPTWMGGRLSKLSILNLHANKFDGNIPEELCYLVSLHILDLSHNNFSGTMPSCLSNFTAMANRKDTFGSFFTDSSQGQFMESALLVMKGKMMEYSTNLGFVRSIDLSSNNFSGQIPTEITKLTELVSLNLSRNSLIGGIPNNIGDMKGLEAIDFSHNRLSGEIPQSMSSLTFLGTLDLSYNNLSGRIPSGTQLQSFNSSRFMGNHLCGLPLTNNCTSNNAPPDSQKEEDYGNGDEVDVWFYESMAIGFAFGFWCVVGSLVFIRKWRHFYFHSLHRLREIFWWNLIARFH